MSKRFTDSDKWKDKWFRKLSAIEKLAFIYCLDNCDNAGVIDVDEELANFQIGAEVDWESFLERSEGRIAHLESGKWWIVKFIEYQYGTISRGCKAHNPVFVSIEKNELAKAFERVSKGYPKGIQRDQDKDKVKDKVKVKVKDKDSEVGEWDVPEHLDTPEVRQLLDDFAKMRRKIKKPIRDLANASRILRSFESVEHLAYALEFCIGNDYQGLKPEYRPPSLKSQSPKQEYVF